MIIICYVVFIAFNINHSGVLPLMALNGLYCADVPLSNYSLTHYDYDYTRPCPGRVRGRIMYTGHVRQRMHCHRSLFCQGGQVDTIKIQ